MADKICTKFPQINKTHLLTGEGKLRKEVPDDSNIKSPSNDYRLVPLINIDAVGGLHRGNQIMNEPEFIVSMVAFNDALNGDKCIQVTGDSMIPACPPGSIVLIREVEKWEKYFGFGNIFVILLKDGRRVLKKITKSDNDPIHKSYCQINLNPQ